MYKKLSSAPLRKKEPSPSARTLAVVIPCYNEREALPELIEEIHSACDPLELEHKILVIDDGSTDQTSDLLGKMSEVDKKLGCVRMRKNFGKSAALSIGLDLVDSDIIITIDGDGQDDPADIPKLIEKLDQGFDLVSGWKQNRQDPGSRRLASKIFNGFTGAMTGVRMHDMNCGFKAYRRECAHSLDVYGEMHRYLPVLADQQGWRVTEIPVHHRARRFGSSRFGLERYLRGALDLMTVFFLGRYHNRPLHLFGGAGVLLSGIGILISAYLSVLWLTGSTIGNRPLLFLGILLIVVGVQLFSLGLLAQIIVLGRRESSRSKAERSLVSEKLGFIEE